MFSTVLLCTFPSFLAVFLLLSLFRWQEGRALVDPMALLVTYMEFGTLHRVCFLFLLAVFDKGEILLHPPLVMLVLFLQALVIVHQAHNILSCIGLLVST